MEMPIVDNEFLDLFLPDSPEVSSNDLIEEFKFYIFRIMNLSVEDLMQEQVNNDFEIGQLRKGFRKKFNEKNEEIINLYNLYCENNEKISSFKYNLEKINSFCNQKADYEVFLKEFEEINSNIIIIKNNLNLSGSYSKNEEIQDIINIPNQMISALTNYRIDLFNQIYDLVKGMNENMKDEIEILENIFNICSKIKLIFVKAILKSILLENQDNQNDFFYLHKIYNFSDLYTLFSDQEFFEKFLLENILQFQLNNFSLEDFNISELDNYKINCFLIFKMNLSLEYFCNRMEKLYHSLDTYFSGEKLTLINENLMCKDFYSINNSLEQMTIKIIILIKSVLKEIIGILISEENKNQGNNRKIEATQDKETYMKNKNDYMIQETFDIFSESFLLPIIENFYFFIYNFQTKSIFDSADLKSKEEIAQTKTNGFNTFINFNPQYYLKSNDKHIHFSLISRSDFLSTLLKELKEISEQSLQRDISSSFSYRINKLVMEKFKSFLKEKLYYSKKNTKSYFKSIKDIKKLITPVIETNNKSLNSPDFNNIDIAESDFIILLELNFNSLLTFFEGFDVQDTKDKQDIIDLIDNHINELRSIVEEFFFENMISVVYPNNEIKEDLLSNFKKGFIERVLKFYENVYSYLDLEILWEEFEKNTKVEKLKDLLTFDIE